MAELRFFKRYLALWNHSAIFRLYDPIFWLRTLSSCTHSGNLVPKHLEEVGTSPPTHLSPDLAFFNEQNRSGPTEPLGHLSIIWAHLLAQNPLSIWCLTKLSSKAFGRSWYITTEPPNYLYHFPEIMIGTDLALFFILFRLRSQIFKTLAQSPLSI